MRVASGMSALLQRFQRARRTPSSLTSNAGSVAQSQGSQDAAPPADGPPVTYDNAAWSSGLDDALQPTIDPVSNNDMNLNGAEQQAEVAQQDEASDAESEVPDAGSEQNEQSVREKLMAALSALASAQPPELFAGRYCLKQDRVHGEHTVVNYAYDSNRGIFQYAIRCFV
jgi:hypothetical protein